MRSSVLMFTFVLAAYLAFSGAENSTTAKPHKENGGGNKLMDFIAHIKGIAADVRTKLMEMLKNIFHLNPPAGNKGKGGATTAKPGATTAKAGGATTAKAGDATTVKAGDATTAKAGESTTAKPK